MKTKTKTKTKPNNISNRIFQLYIKLAFIDLSQGQARALSRECFDINSCMAPIINKIDRKDLNPGDHIYAYRKMHAYSHHGIFIGGDRVIHYHQTREELGSLQRLLTASTSRRAANPCSNCGVDANHLRGVVKSCVDCFLDGRTLRRFQYGVSDARYYISWPGTCTTAHADPPDDIIGRANDILNKKDGFGDYHLPTNNCEVFAVFCSTRMRVCFQARSFGFKSF